MPVREGLPASERRRHIPPRDTTTGPPEHPVEHRAVIGPSPTATRGLVRQQRLQPGSYRLTINGQVVDPTEPRILRAGDRVAVPVEVVVVAAAAGKVASRLNLFQLGALTQRWDIAWVSAAMRARGARAIWHECCQPVARALAAPP